MGVPIESTFDNLTTEGRPKESLNAENPAPDGGLQGWLVVFGGFLTYFTTFGIVFSDDCKFNRLLTRFFWIGLLNSFGTFQVYYGEKFLKGTSASTISWIGSLQVITRLKSILGDAR